MPSRDNLSILKTAAQKMNRLIDFQAIHYYWYYTKCQTVPFAVSRHEI